MVTHSNIHHEFNLANFYNYLPRRKKNNFAIEKLPFTENDNPFKAKSKMFFCLLFLEKFNFIHSVNKR